MPRWEPQAAERLRTAALELFLEHGYDSVTVAQITERAGLTRRTFSRYFADKRDVLFAGSERLPPALADALLRADRSLPPFAALVRAITEVGEQLPGQAALAAQRRTIVQQSTELRERAGTKFAEATDALAEALRQRGTPAASAALLAEVGTALFRSAFERWTDEPGRASFGEHVRAAAAELAASLSAAAARPKPASRPATPRCAPAASSCLPPAPATATSSGTGRTRPATTPASPVTSVTRSPSSPSVPRPGS